MCESLVFSSSSSDTLWSYGSGSENGHLHIVNNIMLCSFTRHVCSPLWQGGLQEETGSVKPREEDNQSRAVISNASFWRIPRNVKSYFTMMAIHNNNTFAKTLNREELASISLYCNAPATCRLGCRRLQWCSMAPPTMQRSSTDQYC